MRPEILGENEYRDPRARRIFLRLVTWHSSPVSGLARKILREHPQK